MDKQLSKMNDHELFLEAYKVWAYDESDGIEFKNPYGIKVALECYPNEGDWGRGWYLELKLGRKTVEFNMMLIRKMLKTSITIMYGG